MSLDVSGTTSRHTRTHTVCVLRDGTSQPDAMTFVSWNNTLEIAASHAYVVYANY